MLTALHADLLFRISSKAENERGKHDWNLIYTHKKSVAFMEPNFVKTHNCLIFFCGHFCTELYLDRTQNVGNNEQNVI
jgi:hypothetical protein